jgi:hypothetical protein
MAEIMGSAGGWRASRPRLSHDRRGFPQYARKTRADQRCSRTGRGGCGVCYRWCSRPGDRPVPGGAVGRALLKPSLLKIFSRRIPGGIALDALRPSPAATGAGADTDRGHVPRLRSASGPASLAAGRSGFPPREPGPARVPGARAQTAARVPAPSRPKPRWPSPASAKRVFPLRAEAGQMPGNVRVT